MNKKKFTLSIETAIHGGSISLLRDLTELDCWVGTREVSRAEDILAEIKKMLERNDVEKKAIKKIVVSRGPGSYTGVRIGMAVGFGLKKALNCKLVGISVFQGMLLAAKKSDGCKKEIIIAVPFGNYQICWQNFLQNGRKNYDNRTQLQISKIGNFLTSFDNDTLQKEKTVILHRKLYSDFWEDIGSRLPINCELIDAGEDIAAFIGMAGAVEDESGFAHPIYIRDNTIF